MRLRISERHHQELAQHLFPGDGQEAIAIALCGRGEGLDSELVLVQDVFLVPYEACRREEDRLDWPPTVIEPLLARAAAANLAILKIHSHPNGFAEFSRTDDESDRRVFEAVFGWIDSDRPHVSAVMLEGGRVFGRAVFPGCRFAPLRSVLVVGGSAQFYDEGAAREASFEGFTERHAQLFGQGTTNLLRRLRIAVVGCSGTGSPVVEQLARLGAAELVLVDPDTVEERNLNRIVGAGRSDIGRRKVDVLKDHVDRMGLGVLVRPFAQDIAAAQPRSAVAASDFVFGCVDSLFGRNVLYRMAQHYLLPYVDVGVKLEALADGTINQVAGAVHYFGPDSPDFIARGVFSAEGLRSEDLWRSDPESYAEQYARGYVRGVEVDRPAVVSVNTTLAGMAVTEMLARLHPFRMDDNSEVWGASLSLSHFHFSGVKEEARVNRDVGKGDVVPPLGLVGLGSGG